MVELYHYGVKGMKWGVRRANGVSKNSSVKNNNKLSWKDVRQRNINRMAKLSGKTAKGISNDDLADYDWDVEGTKDNHVFDTRKLSSTNKDDVKRISKELTDYFEYNLNNFKKSGEMEDYDRVKKYRDTYASDMDVYAKSIIESIEDVQRLLDANMAHSEELYHYGVKGMKWGVRRYQNKNGSLVEEGAERRKEDVYLKKGTIVKRVSLTRDDPVYDNKKYVSINEEDHTEWESYIGGAYVARNKATFSQTYITTKDLKIMTSAKQGEEYIKMLSDTTLKDKVIRDTELATSRLGAPASTDAAENISRNLAMQTETGKRFIERALKDGYGGLMDTHGTNVSSNPAIILDPNSNLAKYAEPEYTKPVKEFLDRYYGRSTA